jgi:hypothetical protein
MICQVCGIEAPTKYVAFYQNIGALIMRFSKSIEGNLCKKCIHEYFWSFTGTTLLLGWWGMISLIISPFLIINNVGRYLFCLGMPPVPPDAVAPTLTSEAIEKIKPHVQHLFDRLNAGVSVAEASTEVAELAGVRPAQVILFLRALAEAQAEQ